jgi:hypothetical protein
MRRGLRQEPQNFYIVTDPEIYKLGKWFARFLILSVQITKEAWEGRIETWELGTISAFCLTTEKNQENLCRNCWLQDLPHIYRIIASSSANKQIRSRLLYTSQACCCCAERLNFMPEYHNLLIRDYSNYNPEGTFYSNIYQTRCKGTQFIYIWKLLYMFRVVPQPIIRSANIVSTASVICHTATYR